MPRNGPIDYATLAESLAALAYPLRLELVDMLRDPHALSEIRVTPHRREGGVAPDRPAAKQTVASHLDQLIEADLVRTEEAEIDGRKVPRYFVNAARLYELTEDLRRLTVRHAGRLAPADETRTAAPPTSATEPVGPRLTLVLGVYEGRSFPLDASTASEWTIGRSRDSHVVLDYDSFVSGEHAMVSFRAGQFHLVDLDSRNGTHVNWTPLATRSVRALRSGDIVGAGRSLLVFRTD